jgi:hypothetical protein
MAYLNACDGLVAYQDQMHPTLRLLGETRAGTLPPTYVIA